jgi:peptidoglycan hydrolase-like protein with peptidoglycan-binding domain
MNSIAITIQNSLIQANIKGISDRNEHIAGIIGNLMAECGRALCPFQQEVRPQWGLGLMQWTNPGGAVTGRRKEMEDFMWANGINRTQFEAERNKHLTSICNNTSVHPKEFLDRVVDVQIRFMLHEWSSTWERLYLTYVNHPTNLTGEDGAMAFAELFCCISLRPGAGGASDNIQDQGVQRALRESPFVGGAGKLDRINYSQLNTRRNNAVEIFRQLSATTTKPSEPVQQPSQTGGAGGMQPIAMTRAQAINAWRPGDLTMVDLRTGTEFIFRGGPPRNYCHSDWMYRRRGDFDTHRRLAGRAWGARPGLIKEIGCIVSFHSFNHSIPVASDSYMIVSPTITRATERDASGNWRPGHHMCMHYIDSINARSNTAYTRDMNAKVLEGVTLAARLGGQEIHPNMPLLMQGSRGTFVSEMQGLINAAGYTPALATDGSFGPLTLAGVRWFQGQRGIAVNGMVTVETWRALRNEQPPAAVTPPNNTPLLKRGDRGPFVEELQREINKHGYTPRLNVDGSFGPLTQAGVEWFQKAHKLPITGTVTPETWGKLRGQPLPAESTDMPLLKRGSNGNFVIEVQRHINAAGHTPLLALDGSFGPLTEAGVRWFQARFGVTVTGTVNQATWKMMRSDRNINTPDLRQGDRGDFVRELQGLINDAGYTPRLAVDGSFGPLTLAGVRWAQQRNNIPVNGIVGYATWSALRGMPLLKRGDRNNHVGEAQKLINALGYTPRLATDNSFGPLTEAAVEWVQRKYGLPVTKTITIDVWYILKNEEGNPLKAA